MLMERLGIDNPTIFLNNMTIPCVMSNQDSIIGEDSTQINTNCKEMEEDMSIIENQDDFWLQEILKLTTVGDSQIQLSQPFSSSSESHHHHLHLQRGDDDFGFSTITSNYDTMIRNMMRSSNDTLSSGELENCGSYQSNKEMDFSVFLPDHDVLPQFRCSKDDTPTTTTTTTSSINSKRKESGRVIIDHQNLHLLDSPTMDSGSFQIQFENYHDKHKKPKLEKHHQSAQLNINFRQGSNSGQETDTEAIAHVKEMIYRVAALRPVTLGIEEHVEKPKRRNVKISSDPQTVAARQRREKISERLRVLQKLVPGGTKMDTATMLDEAANYLKFLKSQVCALENVGKGMKSLINNITTTNAAATTTTTITCQPYFCNEISDSLLVP